MLLRTIRYINHAISSQMYKIDQISSASRDAKFRYTDAKFRVSTAKLDAYNFPTDARLDRYYQM